MEAAYLYLGLTGMLCVLLWTPYILSRAITWGIPTFLYNYAEDFPKIQPEVPLWAERSKRAHLNLIETLPAFVAVILAAGSLAPAAAAASIAMWAQVFFLSRLAHAIVYTLGVPYLRTPVYLVSWAAILFIGSSIL